MALARSLVALAAILATGTGSGQEPPPIPVPAGDLSRARVASVDLRLPPSEEPERAALNELVAIAPGAELSPRALRRTVQLLWQKGRCRNVFVRERPAAPPPGAETGAGRWVALEIECLAVRRLRRVEAFEAERKVPVLDPARLEVAAALKIGDPWDDADLPSVRERIAAAYARQGWRAAKVEANVAGDADVTVRLSILPGDPTRVARVSLEGADAGAAAAVVEGLRMRPGEILDEDALAEDARTLVGLLRAAGRRRAHARAPRVLESDIGVEVIFPVDAGPPMKLAVRGSATFTAAQVEAALGLAPEDSYDPPSLEVAAERLRAFYRARGFAAVRVAWREEAGDGGVNVTLRIDEGRRYRLRRVEFTGASHRAEPWLRERLLAVVEEEGGATDTVAADQRRELLLSVPGARGGLAIPQPLPARERWDEAIWDRAMGRLEDWYRNEGFLAVEHSGTTLELDRREGTIDLTIHLSEGTRTFVESISFEGNAALSLPDLASQARLAPGDPWSWESVEGTRAALLRLYNGRGFLYARVDAREVPGSVVGTAGIVYRVDEGPRVRLGRIVVTGNRRTEDDVIRQALSVAESDWYDPEAVSKSQAALLRLGVFRSVSLRLREPEVPEQVKDLSIELAERPWQTLAQGAGFSIANGPRAFVEWQRPNLYGRAIELAVRGKVNYLLTTFRPDLEGVPTSERIEGRADAGLRFQPFELLSMPIGSRLTAILERLNRRAYRLTRASTVAGVDLALTGKAAVSLQYELEIDDILKGPASTNVTQADLERLRFDEGITLLSSIRPAFTLDYRDNPNHPQRGWLGSGSVEWTRSLGRPDGTILFGLIPGSDISSNFLKVAGTLSGYLPVGGGSTLALSVRGGRVFPMDPESRTIVPRRFFLGGASTMRGWAEEEMIEEDVRAVIAAEAAACRVSLSAPGCTERGRTVAAGGMAVSEGGEAFILVKAEVRVPLKGSLEAGFFADVGNLWLNPHLVDLTKVRADIGLGLRFVTPIGPAALDFGFNVTQDDRLNERTVAPHFGVGLF